MKKENRDKINSYEKNRRDSDLNSKLAQDIGVRTNKVFKSQNVRKTKKHLFYLHVPICIFC